MLANKWRPKSLDDLVGQSHVVNVIKGGRQHHAYLLTGTRGIGKTTTARILAKMVNCGCNNCDTCTRIDEGRFIDVTEIDAASHTGIDNMREILSRAQYSPTIGKYKVYIIDEAHMLSKQAFNSMLKTLEEPPAHVKFILATTDKNKIPQTIMSRCIHLNLRPLQPTVIAERMAYITTQEGITVPSEAITLLSIAAQGSMRDGLSLLDQALSTLPVTKESVIEMLGLADNTVPYDILEALASRDATALFNIIDIVSKETHTFDDILTHLAEKLHMVSMVQAVQTHYPYESDKLLRLSKELTPEVVQLFYQILIHGKRDMPLAPNPLAGLRMTLLRMLTFRSSLPKAAISNTMGNN